MNKLVENCKIVHGLAPCTPSSSTPDYVCMSNYNNLMVIISVDNGNTVTGSAITLKQATAADGTGEKALEFDWQWANADTAASDTLTKTAVTSNTFTPTTTNAKNSLHIIEVRAEDLDMANGFDWVRVGTGDAANTVVDVIYVLYNPRYSTMPTAIA